jgi:hypothetical protein
VSQTDDALPEEWEERTDINTRKVIDVLERRLGKKVEKVVTEKMKGKVDWAAFAGMLVAFLGLTTIFVTALLAPTKAESAAAVAKVEEVKKVQEALAPKLEKLASDVQDLKVSAAMQRAIYDFLVEQKSRASVRAEVERSTQEK